MTREESIRRLKFFKNSLESKEDIAVINRAIKALKQKPDIDKIRAEIKELPTYYHEIRRPNSVVLRDMVVVDEVLQILDRYEGKVKE